MNTEILKVDPKEFGLNETEVVTIEQAFMPKIVERDVLKNVYENLLTQEISPELCKEAKNCRLKLVKVRTGIADIHKAQKAFFLAAGRFVDAWKNKETLPVTQMEEKLSEIEEFYERIEAAKIAELQVKRSVEIAQYQETDAFIPNNLGTLTEQVYNNYLLGVKTAWEQKKDAERKAAEAEAARIAVEKAEQERIRIENEKLKKEAEIREAEIAKERTKAEAERKAAEAKERAEREAHEAALKKEREERERVQRELEAKAEAERKAKEAEEARIEAELSKGDAAKIQDLVNDLVALETKYQFKSAKNKKIYANVGVLLEKVVTYVNESKSK
jgi:colicin import membrane protein